MEKVLLSEEMETLLIPLFGKARESTKKAPVLIDKKAVKIISQIDYDFASLKIPEKTNVMMCLRAKLIDDFVKDCLDRGKESVGLHLGCGLDSRYDRIGNSRVDWYDVDFPEVIIIRRRFYEETDHYHLIGSSVTDLTWLEKYLWKKTILQLKKLVLLFTGELTNLKTWKIGGRKFDLSMRSTLPPTRKLRT